MRGTVYMHRVHPNSIAITSIHRLGGVDERDAGPSASTARFMARVGKIWHCGRLVIQNNARVAVSRAVASGRQRGSPAMENDCHTTIRPKKKMCRVSTHSSGWLFSSHRGPSRMLFVSYSHSKCTHCRLERSTAMGDFCMAFTMTRSFRPSHVCCTFWTV